MKRIASLQPLSRHHHHALVLCWKIKKAFYTGVEVSRIKRYTDWFYHEHLVPHFDSEERSVFPVLGNEHPLIQQALAEHVQISNLFCDTTDPKNSLQQVAIDLEKHIRFEERVLFNHIQDVATPEQLVEIERCSSDEFFVDDFSDVFWK
ncbi:MAG: hemerythrin domain-containing protein [bacterium]|nr:hemerythrin domain-containing protein [bacterium]